MAAEEMAYFDAPSAPPYIEEGDCGVDLDDCPFASGSCDGCCVVDDADEKGGAP
jgi:hypothetical protein